MEPGTLVTVTGGHWRGRFGVSIGEADGTNSVRVVMDHRSAYDAGRPKEWAWVPVEFLTETRKK